jgi:hypothetical protein
VFVHHFAHYRNYLCHTSPVFRRELFVHSNYPAYCQQIAQAARFWLLNCDSRDCGLPQAREPLSLEGGNLWGFPDPAE